MRAFPDQGDVLIVGIAEGVQPAVQALFFVFAGVIELGIVQVRDRQHPGQADAGDDLDGLGVSQDMYAAANQQVADHLTGCRIVGHFIDAHLMGTSTGFQEEIMQQIEQQIAAAEDIISRPSFAHGIPGFRRKGRINEIIGDPLVGAVSQRCRIGIPGFG